MICRRCAALAAAVALPLAGAGARELSDVRRQRLAKRILEAAGTTKGVCLDLGCGRGGLALALARQSEMFVQGLETDGARVEAARSGLRAAGAWELYGRRIAVEQGRLDRLPYPDYMANVVVSGGAAAGAGPRFSWSEVRRVLRPGGLAYVGADGRKLAALRKSLRAAGVAQPQIIERDGVWVTFRRARPTGVGQWSHGGNGSPTGNACVEDDRVRAPFHTLWIGAPRAFTKFGYPLLSNSHVFLRHGGITHTGRWKPPKEADLVQAFDAYNGALLWERRLPDRLGNGFVAVDEHVFAATEKTLYALRAADGTVRWKQDPSDLAEGMKDVGSYACADGMLVVGLFDRTRDPKAKRDKRVKQILLGLRPDTGEVRWAVRPAGGAASVALADGRVFYLSPGRCLAARDVRTGEPAWENTAVRAGGVRYHRGKLYGGGSEFDAKTGRFLRRVHVRGILIGDRVYAGGLKGISVTDLATARRIDDLRVPRDPFCPKTGIPDGCPWMYGRCIRRTASTHCYFFSYSGTAIADLRRNAVFSAESFRSNCRTGVIAGGGIVYNSPSGCACAFPVRGGVALLPVDRTLYEAAPGHDTPLQLETGPAYHKPAPGAASEWPCYRANAARTNVSSASLRVPLAVRWTRDLPGSITPASVGAGTVFVASDKHAVYGMNAKDGSVRWRTMTGGEIWVTPAYWRGRVYVGSQDGWAYCLRASDGALVWRFRGAPRDRKMTYFGRVRSLWPVAGGVLVDGGVAYFYAGFCAHDRVFVHALNARTGTVLWTNDRAGHAVEVTGPETGLSPHGVSPSGILAASEDLLYVPQGMFAPAAFRRSDGAIQWWGRRGDSTQRSSIELQHLGGPQLSLGRGILFFGGPNRVTRTSQPFVAADARTGRMWGADNPLLAKRAGRDPKTGRATVVKRARWGTKPIRFGRRIAPVVVNGGVFTFGYRRGFRDLEKYLATQFEKPKAPLERWPRRPPSGPLIVAGDKVVVASGGALHVLARADGRPLWQGKVAASGAVLPNGLAAANGAVYVVTKQGEMVCLGAGARAASNTDRAKGGTQ
jgi:outer membrane protein assembly factor BamB